MHIKNYREFFTSSNEGVLTLKNSTKEVRQYSLIKGIWNYLFGKDAILCTDRFSIRFVSKDSLEALNQKASPLNIENQEGWKMFFNSLVASVKKELGKEGQEIKEPGKEGQEIEEDKPVAVLRKWEINPNWSPIVKEAAGEFRKQLDEMTQSGMVSKKCGLTKNILLCRSGDESYAFELNITPKEGVLSQEEFHDALLRGLEDLDAWFKKHDAKKLFIQSELFGIDVNDQSVHSSSMSVRSDSTNESTHFGRNSGRADVNRDSFGDYASALLGNLRINFKSSDSVEDFFKKKVIKFPGAPYLPE